MLSDIGAVFIKPTMDSCVGQNCRVLHFSNGTCEGAGKKKSVVQVIEMYGNDFMVSEKVVCCDDIAKIYLKSVNTFRVSTYIWDNKV